MQHDDARTNRGGRRTRLMLVGVMAFMLIAGAAIAQVAGPFDDVPDDHLFAKEIGWMKDTRVTRGCNPPENTEFCPEDAISRGEMAAFIYRYHDTMGGVLTDAQIQEILELVVGELGEGGEGLTAAQVQALIDESLTDYLTETEIRDLIGEVLADEGLTPAEIELLIETALLDLELGLSTAEVQALITTALDGLELGLDAAAVQGLINTALGALDLGLDAGAVQDLIDTALAGATGGILDDVTDTVNGLLGGVEESLETALTDELTLYSNTEEVLVGVDVTASVDCATDEVPIAGGFATGGLVSLNVTESRPTATGWTVSATAGVGASLTAYVTCAKVGA